MALNHVILADVSSLTVGTKAVEAAQSFQASRNVETRPIYTYGASKPVLIVSVPALGSGSFSYVASDATDSAGNFDWSTIIDGGTTISVTGGAYPNDGAPGETYTFEKCSFGGQSCSMNARGEMQINVNFLFSDGTF